MMVAKLQPCLWFDGNAEEAARFYASTFPDTRIDDVWHAPTDYPAGKQGDVLTVEMTILGLPFVLLNGGPEFTFDEAVSFQVATDDQAETDRYWKAIVDNGGQESACGWCKDRFGLSWQITPRRLTELMAGGGESAVRAFEAMMHMRKIDIATLDRAVDGTRASGDPPAG
jgi:predicted 3-demethylubiquinone-9 3-methyltransferase (glyoxalase superfamily)